MIRQRLAISPWLRSHVAENLASPVDVFVAGDGARAGRRVDVDDLDVRARIGVDRVVWPWRVVVSAQPCQFSLYLLGVLEPGREMRIPRASDQMVHPHTP